MINFQEYKKFRLFSVECIVDSVSIGKPLPGSPHYIKQQQQQEQNGSDDSEYLNNNDDYDDDDNNNNDDNSLSQKCQHFPAYRGPLLSRCFEGIRVSVDRATLGEHGAELREMVEMLGGVFDGDAMRYGTSFFVCESNTSQWYQVAAQRDLHIVKPLWVADCFRALRFINPFSDHQRYVLGPLDSCVICTTKFSEQTTKEINTIVTSMGGRLVTEPSDSCTHYITTVTHHHIYIHTKNKH